MSTKRLDLDGSLNIAMSAVDRELAKLAVASATRPDGLSASEVKVLRDLTNLVLACRKDARDAAIVRRIQSMPNDKLIEELQRHAMTMAAS